MWPSCLVLRALCVCGLKNNAVLVLIRHTQQPYSEDHSSLCLSHSLCLKQLLGRPQKKTLALKQFL